ncbi:acyltransferase [Erythrobacter sp. F6033]|uniref:acyltransferase n=1 Tax=Erythrobacter sp. F6033 TaxID=2926401 RepID=UPI001FF59364|nr:acyltransferase [Erythrobacter sp. F6033]MCK0129805.1 acyltransferase [Erythrobacter sp. F6033]
MNAILDWKVILRGWFYRLLSGIWFKRLGQRPRIAGKQRFYRPLMKISIGDDAMLGDNLFWQVARSSEVKIGDRFSLNANGLVVISSGLTIGDNVAIGEMVSLRDSEHKFHPDHGVRGQGFSTAPIVIEDNCWIGRGAYIGPGSHIRRGSIVAAHSVVRGEFPAGSLIAGAPAKTKRSLLSESGTPS